MTSTCRCRSLQRPLREIREDAVGSRGADAGDVVEGVRGVGDDFPSAPVRIGDEWLRGKARRRMDRPRADPAGADVVKRRGLREQQADADARVGDGAQFTAEERGDEEVLRAPAAPVEKLRDQGLDRRGGAPALEFDVDERAPIDRFKNLAQRRNALAFSRIERAQMRKALPRNGAAPVRGAVEAVVVKDDQFAVDEARVDLHAVRAEFERAADRAQRVFRLMSGGPAMADAKKLPGPRCDHTPQVI